MSDRITIPIRHDVDILDARRVCRDVAESVGFQGSDLVCIATAVSEVARNILTYAGEGTITCRTFSNVMRPGIEVVASDSGPGIGNIEGALQDGFSTGGSLGLGLPGARRLMDSLEVTSRLGRGTTVVMKKWVPSP